MSTHYAYTLSGTQTKFESAQWIGASNNTYGYSDVPNSVTGKYNINAYTGYKEDPLGIYTLTTNYGGQKLTTYFSQSEYYYTDLFTATGIAYNLYDGKSVPRYLNIMAIPGTYLVAYMYYFNYSNMLLHKRSFRII